jgi:hypothetical protein
MTGKRNNLHQRYFVPTMTGKRNNLHPHPVDEAPPNPDSSDDEDVAPAAGPAKRCHLILVNRPDRLLLVNRPDPEDDEDDEDDGSIGRCPGCRGTGPSQMLCGICKQEDRNYVYEKLTPAYYETSSSEESDHYDEDVAAAAAAERRLLLYVCLATRSCLQHPDPNNEDGEDDEDD